MTHVLPAQIKHKARSKVRRVLFLFLLCQVLAELCPGEDDQLIDLAGDAGAVGRMIVSGQQGVCAFLIVLVEREALHMCTQQPSAYTKFRIIALYMLTLREKLQAASSCKWT